MIARCSPFAATRSGARFTGGGGGGVDPLPGGGVPPPLFPPPPPHAARHSAGIVAHSRARGGVRHPLFIFLAALACANPHGDHSRNPGRGQVSTDYTIE